MIIKLYWITRLLAYIACLVGIFFFLGHQTDPDPSSRNLSMAIVGAGFISFFLSYAFRAWLHFHPRPPTDDAPPS